MVGFLSSMTVKYFPILLLYDLALELVCGWYGDVLLLSTSHKAQSLLTSSLQNSFPWSETIMVGAENLQNHLSKSTLATWSSVLFGIAANSPIRHTSRMRPS
jgi:hypothetical protein